MAPPCLAAWVLWGLSALPIRFLQSLPLLTIREAGKASLGKGLGEAGKASLGKGF
jgi:hypothetical protein